MLALEINNKLSIDTQLGINNNLEMEKKKVVFYARVSTDEWEQERSLRQQKEYFEQYIKSNKNWEFAGMYIDKGITGTIAKKRPQFMKMIDDAKKGIFDLVLTKEVSRFARNTVDTLHFTRELTKNNVYVYFTVDGIYTKDKDGELRLTIMASLAQEEARKVSERVRWGHRKAMESGKVFGNGNILGYSIIEGNLVVNEKEAEIVRLIFKLYLDGKGCRAIKTYLEKEGYRTPEGKKTWTHSTINRILSNEKYIGKLVQKKYITNDYLEKKRSLNKGEEEKIVIEKNHDPIIPLDMFEEVQRQKIIRRTKQKGGKRHSNKYVFSNKIVCGNCGKNYSRICWNKKKDGTMTYAWLCGERKKNGKVRELPDGTKVGCDSVGIPEYILNAMVKYFIRDLWSNKEYTLESFRKSIEKWADDESDFTEDILKVKNNIAKYQKKIDKLMELYTDDMISKDEFKIKKEEYDVMIQKENELLKRYDIKSKSLADIQGRFKDLIKFFDRDIDFKQEKLPDEIVKMIINKIVVYDKTNFDIYLNTDLSYNVTYERFNNELSELKLNDKQQPFSDDSMYR